jgi:hypothetical protein
MQIPKVVLTCVDGQLHTVTVDGHELRYVRSLTFSADPGDTRLTVELYADVEIHGEVPFFALPAYLRQADPDAIEDPEC